MSCLRNPKKANKPGSLFLGSLLLLMALLHPAVGAEPDGFAILTVSNHPSKASTRIISYNSRSNFSAEGRLIIPAGRYDIVVSAKGYVTRTNVLELLPGDRENIFIRLRLRPFTLKVSSKFSNYMLYLNKDLLLEPKDSDLTLNNVPGGKHELLLVKDHYLYYQHFNSLKKDTISIEAKFINTRSRPLVCGLMGFIPGLNYFVHFPRSTAPITVSCMSVFYTGVIVLIAGRDKIIRTADTAGLPVPATATIIGISIFSMLHAFFSWNGTRIDFERMRGRYTGRDFTIIPGHNHISLSWRY